MKKIITILAAVFIMTEIKAQCPVTITANPTIICSGDTSVLAASGASTYTWSANAGSVTTTSVAVTPTVNTTYTVTATSGTCTATQTVMVSVNPLPTVTVNSTTICAGNSTTLTAAGASTYSWSPGTGLSSTTGASVLANPTVTTNYTVTGMSSAGCVNTATSSVTVNPLPNITVNSPTICIGNSATLNAGGAITYSWNPGTGLSSTSGASVTANPTVTTSYTVIGTNTNGCVNAATFTVTVNTVMPTVTAVASATVVCPGTSAMLTAGGATTYTWSTNAGSATTATVSVSPTSTDTYTVTGDSLGCTSTETVTINVTNGPNVAVSSTPASCPLNNNGTATANGVGPGTVTYTWMPGGLNTPTISGLTPNVYTVTVNDASLCPTTATVAIANPGGGLQTTLAAGNQHNGNMFNITATNTTFITSFDCHLDTASAGAATDSVKIYYIPSTYVGQNANPGAWTYIGTANVVSAGIGVPTVVPINVNVSIPAGQTYGFYITRITATKFLKYTNGTAFGATFASNSDFAIKEGNGVVYPFGAIFPATGTGSRVWNGRVNFCNIVGVEQHLSTEISSIVYPQPMVDNATIKITGLNITGTITLKVFDAMGKLVKETSSTNTEEIKVSRDNMNDGMYFYNVYNDENKIVCKGKFMVQ